MLYANTFPPRCAEWSPLGGAWRVDVPCEHVPATLADVRTSGGMGASITPDGAIARLAFEPHGVVTFAQLRNAGLGAGAINVRVRKGRLHRLHRGVFALGHTRISREGRWLAAVLALGEGAVLSHISAAALWVIRHSSSDRIHVTVPGGGGRERRRGIVVHRSLTLGRPDVDRHNAIPVTSVSRTLLDLARARPPSPRSSLASTTSRRSRASSSRRSCSTSATTRASSVRRSTSSSTTTRSTSSGARAASSSRRTACNTASSASPTAGSSTSRPPSPPRCAR